MTATNPLKQVNSFTLFSLYLLLTLGLIDARRQRQNPDDPDQSVTRPVNNQQAKLKLTVGDKTVVLPLIDSPTSREFSKLLPMTLDMSDINNREKYSSLPTKLSGAGNVSTTYKIGDLSYWRGGGIAAFYNHDGREVKAGLVVLANLGKNVDLFKVAGSVKATFELAKD